MSSWDQLVKSPNERKVFAALADPQWDFRTVEGLSKATGLSASEIHSTLEKYPDLVRKSLVRDEHGRDLFTLATRPAGPQELVSQFRSFVTKSAR